jgi:hypothetical protein
MKTIPAGSDAVPKGAHVMGTIKPMLVTVIAVIAGLWIGKRLKLI